MVNSKSKGKRGELEAVNWFKKRGFNAQRTQQHKGSVDSADIEVKELQEYHFEIKRNENLSIYKAIEQAENDCEGQRIPVVMHRKSRKPWLVTMLAEDWVDIRGKS